MSASAYFKNGALIESFGSTLTSGGTLTLTSSSDAYQIFTGSQAHTMKLPDATTMIANQKFEVINASTGAITVQNNGGATVGTVAAGTSIVFRVTDISTSNGSFDVSTASSGGTGGLSSTEAAQFNALAASGFSATSKKLVFDPEQMSGNYWVSKAPIQTIVYGLWGFPLNGFTYAVGGSVAAGNAGTGANQQFNDDSNYSLLKQPTTDIKRFINASLSFGGFGYVTGGNDTTAPNTTNLVEQYSDSLNTWTNKANLNIVRRSHAPFYNVGMYVGFGIDVAGTFLSSVETYSPAANAWYLRASGITAGRDPGSFNVDALLNVVGGNNGSDLTANQRYDEVTNAWTSKVAIPSGGSAFASFAVNGTGYMAGNGGGSYTSTVRSYNSATEVWGVMASLSGNRGQSAGVAINGFGYSMGGYNGSAGTNVVEQFVPSSIFYMNSLMKSVSTPTAISVAVLLNALAPNVGVQIRTDGDLWRNFVSGGGSATKLNETLSTKFVEYPTFLAAGGYNGSDILTTETYNDVANTWQTRANAPVGGDGFTAFPFGGLSYFAGGSGISGTIPTSFRTFNDLTNAWASKSALSFSTSGSGIRFNGFGYSVGAANNSNLTYKYNPTTDTWASSANLAAAGRAPALSDVGGKIYAVGGTISSGVGIPTTQYYSDVTNVWTALGSGSNSNDTSQSGGTYDGCSFHINNYAYRGGNGSNQTIFERFDVSTLVWTSKQSMNFTSYIATSTSMGDFGYSAGGNNGSFMTAAQKYNSNSNTWTTLTSLGTARAFEGGNPKQGTSAYRNYELKVSVPSLHAGVGSGAYVSAANVTTNHNVGGEFSLQGYGYMINGFVAGGSQTSQNDRYDEVTNSWLQVTSNSTALYSVVCFALNGRGHRAAGQTANGPHEVYNAELGVWTSAATVGSSAADFAQGSVLNGRGYILGASAFNAGEYYNETTNAWTSTTGPGAGTTSGRWSQGGFIYAAGADTPSTTVQKFNDTLQSWSSAGSMNVARRNHAVLFKGRGLMAGSATSYVTSTESYNEASNVWSIGPTLLTGVAYQAVFTLNGGAYSAAGWNGSSVLANQKMVDSVKQAVLSAGLAVS